MVVKTQSTNSANDKSSMNDSIKQVSPDTKIRQMLAYLAYYNGGVIDYTKAVLMAVNAEATRKVLGMKPIAFKAKNWLDEEAIETVVQTMVKLGRIGDAKNEPRFAVMRPNLLTIKPMPEKFFSEPFNESEKEALNRALQAAEVFNPGEEFNSRMDFGITLLRMQYREKRPIKAWEGFDPIEVQSVAPGLKSERLATLPKYPPLPKAKKALTSSGK
ncbi:MAG: hypothetical protein LUC43_02860 [Burkholderiales bacterium]|nr:hypothetical protein [Burkholderiales bacterium]